MKRTHPLIFPTAAVYWFIGGVTLIHLVVSVLLAPAGIYLMPRGFIVAFLRFHAAPVILLLGIPCGIYLLAWRASDMFAWMVSPRVLEWDVSGFQVGRTRIAWRDITEIVEQYNHDRVVLRHRSGAYKLRLNMWRDSERLHEVVLERVVPPMLRRVSAEVAAGEAPTFGPLTLSSEGLTYKRKLMRWEDIESIRLQNEHDQGVATRELIIDAGGKIRKIDESKIVNAPVLLAYLSDRLAG
ncbi:hypothetical protein LZ198_26425 [Myxococcus sp. K15C18031901]|uniref:DUF6585 family protein n=1 Tax=Myxococcus dinghuensis TaxID=2906761 RepID=UPI0020A7F3E2|nr:DUF6585 family protein [Myxococcus dinghuensis]MCP3102413.1 hypothetical protein [Myxococcus dinghuensis]